MSKHHNPTQGDLPTPGVQVSQNYEQQTGFIKSIKKMQIDQIAQQMHSLRISPIMSTIGGLLNANTHVGRASHLHAFVSLLTDAPPLTTILKYALSFEDMIAFVRAMAKPKEGLEEAVETTVQQSIPDIAPEAIPDATFTIDPTKSAQVNITNLSKVSPVIATFLQKHSGVVRILFGGIALVACMFGVDRLLSCADTSAWVGRVIKLGALFSAGGNIYTQLMAFVDSLLPTVYSFFGITYVSPSFQKIKDVSSRVDQLYNKLARIISAVKEDHFGFQMETLSKLEEEYHAIEKTFQHVTTEEKSMFNFTTRLQKISLWIDELREMLVDLYKTAGGKQRPTVIWFCGRPNTGKTFVSNKISQDLSARHSSSAYSRVWSDEYWSGYRGQVIVNMDDMCQTTDGKDVVEFHRYTSDDAKDTIGAALSEKGRPFVSKYIAATSNYMWIAPPGPCTEYFALNRRRDIVIYCSNPHVEEYVEKHNGQTPEDPAFYTKHPTRYYLINPTYGHTLNRSNVQSSIKFFPSAEWVIKEVTYQEIINGAYELQQFRAEMFRQRMIGVARAGNTRYPVPQAPIEYNAARFIHNTHSVDGVPTSATPDGSTASLDDIDALPLSTVTYVHGSFDAFMAALNTATNLNLGFAEPDNREDCGDAVIQALFARTNPDKEFYIAVNGTLIASTKSGYRTEAQWHRFIIMGLYSNMPYDVLEINHSRNEWHFTHHTSEGTIFMSNNVRTVIKVQANPVTIIGGPPGTGKTFLIEKWVPDNYRVKYTADEEIPIDKTLLLDDFANSKERLNIAKNIIADYYDSHKYKNVIATYNDQAQVWLDATAQDKDMILRRSHHAFVGYTAYTSLRAIGSTPAIFLKNMADREGYVYVTMDLTVTDDTRQFEKVKWTLSTLGQFLQMTDEASVVNKEIVKYNDLVLPLALSPDLKIILDDSKAPTVTGSQMLIREGPSYRTLSLLEKAKATILFTRLATMFSQKNVIDITVATSVINAAEIVNPIDVKSIVLVSPGWTIGVETIDGKLVAYRTTEQLVYDYEPFENGFHFGGHTYRINDHYDQEVSAMLMRLGKRLDSYSNDDLAALKPKTAQDYVSNSLIVSTVSKIISMCDVGLIFAASTGSVADAFFGKTTPEFERKSPPPVPEVPGEDSSALKKGVPLENKIASPLTVTSITAPTAERKARKQADVPDRDDDTDHAGDPAKTPKTRRFERKKRVQGLPDRDDDTDHQGDGAKQPTTRRYEGIIVDNSGIAFAKKMAVVRIGIEGNCEYGVLYGDEVMYATELNHQRWTVFVRPVNSFRVQLTVVYESNLQYDRMLIQEMKGRSFALQNASESDFSSMLAYYIVRGDAYDAETGLNMDDEFITVLGKRPTRMSDTTKIEHSRRMTNMQGSYDTQAFKTLGKLYENYVEIKESGSKVMMGIMLKQRIGLTNAHAPKIFTVTPVGTDAEYSVRVFSRSTENDIALFEVTDVKCKQYRDITTSIPTAEQLGTFLTTTNGKMAVAVGLSQPQLTIMLASGDTATKAVSAVLDRGRISYRASINYFGSTGVTERGDCGSAVVMMAPTLNHKFVGIHSRGAADISIAAPITRDYINALITRDFAEHESADVETTDKQSCDIDYNTIPFHDQRTNQLCIGTPKYPVHVPVTTTKYRSGLNTEKLECLFEPTIKCPNDYRNVLHADVLSAGISRYQPGEIDKTTEAEIDEAADEIANYINANMAAKDFSLRVLTNTESINGPPTEEYPASKPIDRKGSVGYPYTQKNPGRNRKEDYLFFNDSDGKWYFRNDQESRRILSDVDRIYSQGAKGVAYDTPWIIYPKDECVKLEKIYDVSKQKTRVFFSGPMSYQLAYRRLFGAALWRLTEMHMDIPVRVGIAQRSLEWHIMASQHLSIGKFGFASDMSNWDGSVPLKFLQVLPRIYNQLYQQNDPNWKPSDDTARYALHKAVEGATVIVRGRVLKLRGCMASGYPGTAIDNSLINWMLFYCCWRRALSPTQPQMATFAMFMKHTKLSVYGDDNICSVADPFLPLFNFNVFKTHAAAFGFKVTDAAKTGNEAPDYQPFEELEFLKRGFTSNGWITLPKLDKNSINKTLHWITGSPGYIPKNCFRIAPDSTVFEASLEACLVEIALHGEEYYTKMCAQIRKAAAGTGINVQTPLHHNIMATTPF